MDDGLSLAYIRVDAVMLESLIQEQKDLDLIPKVVTGLLAHRKAGRWLNTQENTFALVAMDLYFDTYEKATPDFVARVWLGNVELDRNRLEAAEEHFRHALEIDPGLAAGWYGLGRIEARRGDDRQAVEHFEKTLELQPEADLVYYALGQSLPRLRRLDELIDPELREPSHRLDLMLSLTWLVRTGAADRPAE